MRGGCYRVKAPLVASDCIKLYLIAPIQEVIKLPLTFCQTKQEVWDHYQ